MPREGCWYNSMQKYIIYYIAIAAVAQFKVHLLDHLTIVHIMEIINQKNKKVNLIQDIF